MAIQSPRGNFMILPVADDAVLKNLKVGERVIMTYAEAVALSLNKDEVTQTSFSRQDLDSAGSRED